MSVFTEVMGIGRHTPHNKWDSESVVDEEWKL